MAREVSKKMVYRDVATGKLIPKKVAINCDPSTWVEEEFWVVIDHDDGALESFADEEETETQGG